MGAVARGDKIKTRLRKRQFLDRALLRRQVGKPARGCFLRHRAKHFGGKIVSDDVAHMGRKRETRMSAAAAQIERVGEAVCFRKACKIIQVFALRMNRALHISGGARAELFGD